MSAAPARFEMRRIVHEIGLALLLLLLFVAMGLTAVLVAVVVFAGFVAALVHDLVKPRKELA
jgi:uncharacterized membrane protein